MDGWMGEGPRERERASETVGERENIHTRNNPGVEGTEYTYTGIWTWTWAVMECVIPVGTGAGESRDGWMERPQAWLGTRHRGDSSRTDRGVKWRSCILV